MSVGYQVRAFNGRDDKLFHRAMADSGAIMGVFGGAITEGIVLSANKSVLTMTKWHFLQESPMVTRTSREQSAAIHRPTSCSAFELFRQTSSKMPLELL